MGIIEEIKFFFFDVEDPARNQKLCAKRCEKLKSKRGQNLHKAFTERFKALYMLTRFQKRI